MGFRQTGFVARARQFEYGKLQTCGMATVLRAAEANEVQTDPRKGPPNALELVKKLRERTASSVRLCKQALQASNWVSTTARHSLHSLLAPASRRCSLNMNHKSFFDPGLC